MDRPEAKSIDAFFMSPFLQRQAKIARRTLDHLKISTQQKQKAIGVSQVWPRDDLSRLGNTLVVRPIEGLLYSDGT